VSEFSFRLRSPRDRREILILYYKNAHNLASLGADVKPYDSLGYEKGSAYSLIEEKWLFGEEDGAGLLTSTVVGGEEGKEDKNTKIATNDEIGEIGVEIDYGGAPHPPIYVVGDKVMVQYNKKLYPAHITIIHLAKSEGKRKCDEGDDDTEAVTKHKYDVRYEDQRTQRNLVEWMIRPFKKGRGRPSLLSR